MNAEIFRDLVGALAKADGIKVKTDHKDMLELRVDGTHGSEIIFAGLSGTAVDGYPTLEFTSALHIVPASDQSILPVLASSIAVENRDALDVGWAYRRNSSEDHQITVSMRIDARQLSLQRLSTIIRRMSDGCRVFHEKFFAKSGHLVVYPLDIVRSARRRAVHQSGSDGLALGEAARYLDPIRCHAQVSGWAADYLNDHALRVSFEAAGVEVVVFVTVIERDSDGDVLLRFSSIGKPLPNDTTTIETTAYRLLIRNASSLYAHWALGFKDDSFYAVATRNTSANDLDRVGFWTIMGSFVPEYQFCAAELGGF